MQGLEHALKLFQSGRHAEADAACKAFLKKAPGHPSALFLRGMCAVARGARTEAVSFLEKAVAAAPQWPEANTQLGILYTEAAKFELAEKCFRRAIKAAPQASFGHHNLALMLRQAERYPEAIEAEATAVKLDPDDPHRHRSLGDAYWDAGRFDEALPHHQAAVQRWRGPVDEAFFEHVWRELASRDRNEEACAVADAWLERDPSSEYARHCRAASRGETMGRAADAYVQRLFDGFAESFDEQLDAIDYRGWELVANALRAAAPDKVPAGLDAGCGTGRCGPVVRPLAERLVGVDLSPKMIEVARKRGCYDELVESELTAYLESRTNEYGWIVSADTLVYVGELAPLARAASSALTPQGHVSLTIENAPSAVSTFRLAPSGRYQHAPSYVESVFGAAGFEVVSREHVILRKERGIPVDGMVYVMRRS